MNNKKKLNKFIFKTGDQGFFQLNFSKNTSATFISCFSTFTVT